MDKRADDRNATPPNTLKVWTAILSGLSQRMTRDYWGHAEALGRYVDDIARARTFATYEEARRTYRQRVLALLEQSASGYASLWEVGGHASRSNNKTAASVDSADVVHDAPPPTVRGAATGPKVPDTPAPPVAEAKQKSTDLARARAAADALLDSMRSKAAAAAQVSAAPSKKRRVRKVEVKVKGDAVAAPAPKKPRKRPHKPIEGSDEGR